MTCLAQISVRAKISSNVKSFLFIVSFSLFPFHLSFSFFAATGKLFGEKTLSEMTLHKIGRYANYCYGQKLENCVQFSTRILIPPDPKIIYACVYGNSQ